MEFSDSTTILSEINEKIRSLEEKELRDQDDTSEDVYKHLLVYYLIQNEVMKAKFMWKRVPKHFKQLDQNSELNRIWNLAQFLIQRQYAQAFEIVQRFRVQNSNKINFFSNQELNNLLSLLVDKSIERLFDLINTAYSSISIQEMATQFCLNPTDIVKMALGKGWQLDESKLFLLPKRRQDREIVEIPNRVQMKQLTNLVSYLEAL